MCMCAIHCRRFQLCCCCRPSVLYSAQIANLTSYFYNVSAGSTDVNADGVPYGQWEQSEASTISTILMHLSVIRTADTPDTSRTPPRHAHKAQSQMYQGVHRNIQHVSLCGGMACAVFVACHLLLGVLWLKRQVLRHPIRQLFGSRGQLTHSRP
jgi:hypothetical protein